MTKNIKTDPKKILCVQCGNRGFKRKEKQYNSMSIHILECLHCSAHIYDHATMQVIQTENEISATNEYSI